VKALKITGIVLGCLVLLGIIGAIFGHDEGDSKGASGPPKQVVTQKQPPDKQSIYAAGADGFFKTYPKKFKEACRGMETGAWEQTERLAEEEGIPGDTVIAISTYLYKHCDFR
jgi:hypothetical protein